LGAECGGHPDLHVALEELESLRHHADDYVRLAVEQHGAADDAGFPAETALPEAVADDGNRRSAGTVLALHERPSERRRRAEHVEERPGDAAAGDPLG